MDLQEKRQLELAEGLAKVKKRARPWRAIIALVLAIAAACVSYTVGRRVNGWFEAGHLGSSVIAVSAAAAFLVFAIAAVVGLASQSRKALQPVTGSAHAAVIRYAIVLIGTVAALIITLALFKVPVGQLIVGGALTTILIGIAAQQSLSNVFSGIVLLLSRPFSVGDVITLRSGALGGQLDGTVTEIGITYVRLDTDTGVMSLPNSQVLAAGVSRRPAVGRSGTPDGQRLPPPGTDARDGGSPAS